MDIEMISWEKGKFFSYFTNLIYECVVMGGNTCGY